MGRLPGSGRAGPGWGKPDGGEGKGPAAAAGPDRRGREMNWRGRTGGMERPVFLAKSRPSDPKKKSLVPNLIQFEIGHSFHCV